MIDKKMLESMKSSKFDHPDCKDNETFLGYIPRQEIKSLIKTSDAQVRLGFPIPCGYFGAIYPAFITETEVVA